MQAEWQLRNKIDLTDFNSEQPKTIRVFFKEDDEVKIWKKNEESNF
jgi:hypothetical protein